ncbi:MAG: phosphotransferase [Methylomonas sp.]|nr:phosphotransferase [Methylomonas sp.]
MGVIKKTLFRGQLLGKPRHTHFFLDMEENIHIHYRDLRIELSRNEFEDFVEIFSKQSAELNEIIQEKNYQDGQLANANQEDIRIWTESRLKHPLKYHPRRFSLEECNDGYHFHYRNLKILIDKNEFREIVDTFKAIDPNAPYASSYREVKQLLDDNEIDYTMAAGNQPGEVLSIAVAPYHLKKVYDIFGYIGFNQSEAVPGEKCFENGRLRVIVRTDKQRSVTDYRKIRGNQNIQGLLDYLLAEGPDIDADQLNRIKCQVLNLYYALKNGEKCQVDIDPRTWLYAPDNAQVIFPYQTASQSGNTAAESLYRAWSSTLKELNLAFVKPAKQLFSTDTQTTLSENINKALRQDIAAFRAVDRIYLMGSATRRELGYYSSPFVHGKLAKLGSDIDILVEIDPAHEEDIPGDWSFYVDAASNHCAIYHIGQIPLNQDISQWTQLFPNIAFTHHLLDAYVYFPSRGHEQEKNAFLDKFKAQLIYDRERDGIVYRSDTEGRIAARLAQLHGFERVAVEPMTVSTENILYKVFAGGKAWILKLFKAAGNYSSKRIVEHTDYEERLVRQLIQRGIVTAAISHVENAADGLIEDHPALLFELLQGKVLRRPEYALEKICAALAKIHAVQMEQPLELEESFGFDDTCMIWLQAFENYQKDRKHHPEIAAAFDQLLALATSYYPGDRRFDLYARSPSLHNHGDVAPKNVIVADTGDVRFFDFNNAFYGPRIVDVIDGAFEFALAEKYIHLADFKRFDRFIEHYDSCNPLTSEERQDLSKWIGLIGIIMFTKEVRVFLERPEQSLRRKRAVAIAEFLVARAAPL